MSGRVVVVDSDPSISALYVNVLAREGYQAEAAPSPEHVAVRVDQSPVDLVVLDVDLPEKKGPKIVWALREKGYAMPIIGLIEPGSDWDPDDLVDLGFSLLLNKPVEGHALLMAVRNLVKPRTREAAGGANQSA